MIKQKNEDVKEHIPNWWEIPGHQHRILIVEDFGIRKSKGIA